MKILILKLGYSETLDAKIDLAPSIGDVFRTTAVLSAIEHKWKKAKITWITDRSVVRLLPDNLRILTWDSFLSSTLLSEKFDLLINFEKTAAVCLLADSIQAKRRLGFHYDPKTNSYSIKKHGEDALKLVTDPEAKRLNTKPWQQILVEMIGCEWSGQRYKYFVGECKEEFDIGFNFMVGNKWPNKAWPLKHWLALDRMLSDYKVSWQQGQSSLDDYTNWLKSCSLIVTNDSLGLHLALAMHKKVVALFGPTSDKEVFLYNQGVAITTDAPCRPCYEGKCKQKVCCMEQITPEQVLLEIKKLI